MLSLFAAAFIAVLGIFSNAYADEAEIKAAQSTIASQIEAFKAGDEATAYSYAAPNIKRIFPTLESFMDMVKSGYRPVWHPKSYSFGEAQETSGTSIIQRVMVIGPDGKSYEAVYTLERGADGVYRITSVSLRASKALSV